jgi:type IX secretion system PorP/SprF family membrane protein
MRTKIFSLLFLTCLIAISSTAQQLFNLTEYTQYNFIYNPAASGASDKASAGIIYRNQWTGMPGGPVTAFAFADKYFEQKKTGVSAVLFSDVTGPTSRTGGLLNLSYSIDFENGKRLMFGLGGQLLQFKVDETAIADAIPNDPLLAGKGTSFIGDANTGIYYKSPTLNVGVSAMQIIQSNLRIIKESIGAYQGELYRHYFLMAYYNIQVDKDNILVPNALVKYLPNSPVDIEAGLRLEHKQFISVGFNYHYQQNYSFTAGLMLTKNLSLGYAYDRYNTPINLFYGGNDANEVSLRYFFH